MNGRPDMPVEIYFLHKQYQDNETYFYSKGVLFSGRSS